MKVIIIVYLRVSNKKQSLAKSTKNNGDLQNYIPKEDHDKLKTKLEKLIKSNETKFSNEKANLEQRIVNETSKLKNGNKFYK